MKTATIEITVTYNDEAWVEPFRDTSAGWHGLKEHIEDFTPIEEVKEIRDRTLFTT